ncbi:MULTISPECIES: phage head morphogenesis protein [Olivibacter]|uniref:Phage minor head protein n=1 Tax=Olivibacter jilunii TaxID=985016 RepID=A0ABW6AYT9_9SPHI
MSNIDKLYSSCCSDHNVKLSLTDQEENNLFEKLLNMVLKVWKNKGTPKGGIDEEIVTQYVEKLWEGVVDGYGEDLTAIDFDTPDYNMLLKLRENIWQFSAAKNYQQLAAINRELIDANGKLRSFSDFRDAALRINIDHVRHLETEYTTAVGGAQMAGLWVQIQQEKEVLPWIELVAIIDDHTTKEICLLLDGVIVHVDDPYLDVYYPLNHYNCRLTVRRLADATPTPKDKLPYPEIPKIFRTNMGKRGLAFPTDHPYFEGTPKDVLEKAKQSAQI